MTTTMNITKANTSSKEETTMILVSLSTKTKAIDIYAIEAVVKATKRAINTALFISDELNNKSVYSDKIHKRYNNMLNSIETLENMGNGKANLIMTKEIINSFVNWTVVDDTTEDITSVIPVIDRDDYEDIMEDIEHFYNVITK